MDTEPISPSCPKCHAPLPADAPRGLCPKCLLAAVAAPTEASQPAGRPAPPPVEAIAAAFPQLEILEFIGQGGMGFVFKARQPKLDRLVALKILPQSLAADPTFAERFHREAKLLARLNHPGIVTVHDFGSVQVESALSRAAAESGKVRPGESEPEAPLSDLPPAHLPTFPLSAGQTQASSKSPARLYYLLMEFVDGVNLRQAMQAGRFTPDQALAIVPKICEALQFAHNEGILHRDIKPENILLDAKGRVKIADFGIAKLVGDVAQASQPAGGLGIPAQAGDSGLANGEQGCSPNPQAGKPALQPDALTEAGKALGTPNYMAPEQLANAGDVDHRADIYSLGVVFYEMLTGELPRGRFAPPSQKSAADPRVDEVVLRALEKEKARRPASADEVRTQVETITGTPGSSGRESAPTEALSIGEREREKGGIVIVGRRNGKRAVVWRGVSTTFFAIAGCLLITMLLIRLFFPIGVEQVIAALFLAAFVAAGGVIMGLRTPVELLAPLDDSECGRRRGDDAQTEKRKPETSQSLLTSAATNQKSRFSRLAIVGAVWAAACALHFLIPTLGFRMKSEFVPIMMSILGLSAPLGTTVLGWMAVRQIRRSAGKLRGLWLAVFEGLIFPLLVAAAACAVGFVFLQQAFNEMLKSLTGRNPHIGFGAPIFFTVSLLVLTPIVFRLVWRKVNKPAAGPHTSEKPTPATNRTTVSETKPTQLGKCALGLFIGAVVGFPVLWGFMGAQEVMVLCGLALLLSLVLGLLSWRSQSGKFAALASGLGLLLLVGFTVTYITPRYPARGRSLSFSPEVSHTLTPNPTGANRFIDFDTGKVLSLPPEIASKLGDDSHLWALSKLHPESKTPSDYLDWIERNGVDAVVMPHGLTVFKKSCSVGHGNSTTAWGSRLMDWNAIEAAEVQKAADMIEREYDRFNRGGGPGGHVDYTFDGLTISLPGPGSRVSIVTGGRIWIFKTRGGKAGALLLDEQARMTGPKFICYKLVQGAETKSAGDQPSTSKAAIEPNRVLFTFSHDRNRKPMIGHRIALPIHPEGDTGWQPANGQAMRLADGRTVLFKARVAQSKAEGIVGKVATKTDYEPEWRENQQHLRSNGPSTLTFANGLQVSMSADHSDERANPNNIALVPVPDQSQAGQSPVPAALRTPAIGIGALLMVSLALGVMGWRTRVGKSAAIASGLGLLLCVAFAYNSRPPRKTYGGGRISAYTQVKDNLFAAMSAHYGAKESRFELGKPIDVDLLFKTFSPIDIVVNPAELPLTAWLTVTDSNGTRVELTGQNEAALVLKEPQVIKTGQGASTGGYAMSLLLLPKNDTSTAPKAKADAMAWVEPGTYNLQFHLRLPPTSYKPDGSSPIVYRTVPLTIEVKGQSAPQVPSHFEPFPPTQVAVIYSHSNYITVPGQQITVPVHDTRDMRFQPPNGQALALAGGSNILVRACVIKNNDSLTGVVEASLDGKLWERREAALSPNVHLVILRFDNGLRADLMPGYLLGSSGVAANSNKLLTTSKTPFGPVVERELRVDEETIFQGLDFESGMVLTLTLEEYNRADEYTGARQYPIPNDWLKAKGVDMVAAAGEKGFGLAGPVTAFKLGALPVAAWDTATESDINEALEHATMEGDKFMDGLIIPTNAPVPLTYAMRSGDKLGLLQITARLQNPNGIKLRYKLVENSSSAPKDTSPVIPTIRFKDATLLEALEFFRSRWPVNLIFDPAVTEEQKGFPITAQWDGLTARQAMAATLDAAGLQLVENLETGVARIVNRPENPVQPTLIPFGQGKPDTSPVIPKIRFQDTTLLEALEFFRLKWPINLVFDSTITDAQKSARATVTWENLTALQALNALLGSQGLQLVENPQTGVAKIVNQPAFSWKTPAFGPVIEKDLPYADQGLPGWFNLDTGKTPPDHFPGASICVSTDGRVSANQLVLLERAKRGQWDTLSAPQLVEAMRDKPLTNFTSHAPGPEGPLGVWVFKTWRGNIGLLQIASVATNPPSVKIRYKLVQDAAPVKPAQQAQYEVSVRFGYVTNSPIVKADVALGTPFNNFESIGDRLLSISGQIDAPKNGKFPGTITVGDWNISEKYKGTGSQGGIPVELELGKPFTNVVISGIARFRIITLTEKPAATAPLAEPKAGGSTRVESAVQKPSFGPVVERLVPRLGAGKACLLDFETGEFRTPPDDLAEKMKRNDKEKAELTTSSLRWLRESGVDLTAAPDSDTLWFLGVIAIKPQRNGNRSHGLEDLTPENVIDVLSGPLIKPERKPGIYSAIVPAGFGAMGFITSQGTMGVLEIPGGANDPAGVKIRYKLLRGVKPSAEAMAAAKVVLDLPPFEAVKELKLPLLDLPEGTGRKGYRLTVKPGEGDYLLATLREYEGSEVIGEETPPKRQVARLLRTEGVTHSEDIFIDSHWVLRPSRKDATDQTPATDRCVLNGFGQQVVITGLDFPGGSSFGSQIAGQEQPLFAARRFKFTDSGGNKARTRIVEFELRVIRSKEAAALAKRHGLSLPDENVANWAITLSAPLAEQTKPANTSTSAGALFQLRLVAAEGDTNSPADLLVELHNEQRRETHRVLKPVLLDERDVESAVLATNDFGRSIVFQLTTEGAKKFTDITGQNIGRQMAMVWNGRVLAAPVIREAIQARDCRVSGVFTDTETRQLLDVLNHRPGSIQTNTPSTR